MLPTTKTQWNGERSEPGELLGGGHSSAATLDDGVEACCGFVDSARCEAGANEARAVLNQSRYNALRHLACDEVGGVIRISGRVPSHYLKQVAFATVGEVVGARPICNAIQVVPHASASSSDVSENHQSGWFRAPRSLGEADRS